MTPPDMPLPGAEWRPGARLQARRRRDRGGLWRGPNLTASLVLHAALFAVLLLSARPRPQDGAISPQSFEVMLEPGGPKGPAEETGPAELPGPPLPAAPAAPPAPVPHPSPAPAEPARTEVEPSSSVRLPVLQPPRFAMPAPVPIPQPDPEPPHAPAPAETAPAEPAFPAPMDLSLGQDRDAGRRRPSQRGNGTDFTPGRSILDAPGTPPRDTSAAQGNIRIRGAQVGKAWEELLHEWWAQHSYYPAEAARRGQDGTAKIHVRVDRYGRVQLVEMESTSGSLWLDAGAQAVFRNAIVPPFPPSTPEPSADLDITIEYVLIRR